MKLKNIQIQNFLSISQVETELDNKGLTLILGENKDDKNFSANGVGKSALIESIVYAIFGKTLRGLTGDSVVNRTVGKNMKISLDLEVDGVSYRVIRYRKHHENKNQSILFRGTTNITPKSETDLNNFMQDLFQIDYATFTSSVLYSEHSFNFSTATDSELKKAFDVILGFDTLVKCQDKAKERVRLVESEQKSLESKLTTLQSNLDNLEQKVEVYKSKSKDFTTQTLEYVTDAKSRIKENVLKVDELGNKALELAKNVDSKKKELSEINSNYLTAKKEFEDSKTTYNALKQEVKLLEASEATAKTEVSKNLTMQKSVKSSLQKLKTRQTSLESDINETTMKIGKPCPSCGVPMSESGVAEVIKTLKKQLRLLQVDIEDLEDELKELEETNEKLNQDLDNATSAVETKSKEADAEYGKLDSTKVNTWMGKLTEGRQQLGSMETREVTLDKEIQSYVKSNESMEKQILDRESQENPYDEMLESISAEMNDINSQISTINSDIANNQTLLQQLKFWVEGFGSSGIKSRLLDDVTPYLNKRANKYLQFLTEDSIQVEFSTQSQLKSGEFREKFNIAVTNKHGGDAYIGNSGGERKRIDLAITLALQDLVASRATKPLNIVFFDEIFDALDAVGVERVAELLQDVSGQKSSVFVVSHNDTLKTYFENEITLVKEHGKTTLKS